MEYVLMIFVLLGIFSVVMIGRDKKLFYVLIGAVLVIGCSHRNYFRRRHNWTSGVSMEEIVGSEQRVETGHSSKVIGERR
jgi:hypothetical protein